MNDVQPAGGGDLPARIGRIEHRLARIREEMTAAGLIEPGDLERLDAIAARIEEARQQGGLPGTGTGTTDGSDTPPPTDGGADGAPEAGAPEAGTPEDGAAAPGDAAEGDDADDEAFAEEAAIGAFASPEAHAAYLAKWAPRLKRRTVNFALGMASKDPSEMRLNFHPKKAGRGLAAVLKKEGGAKKTTFGRAGTDALSESVGAEGEGARTLILTIEGRSIPSLEKRVRLMLRTLGVSVFGKVKIVEAAGGEPGEVEAYADEDGPAEGAGQEMPRGPDPRRMQDLGALESRVDALLAEFE
jgi:hypothetical protein